MRVIKIVTLPLVVLLACGPASGQGHHGHVAHHENGGAGAHWGHHPQSYFPIAGPYCPLVFVPPLLTVYPGGGVPILEPMILPPPAPAWIEPMPAAPKPKRIDPARASQLVTIGDRLFRAGNTRRAADRFEQARKADPNAAAPHIRLAQIALVRGRFTEAAGQVRDALTAEPNWLTTAPDIQSIYAEPGDFARQIARLESHLHANPTDRDAWLVLGAQLYLSGRTRKAADIFLRLTDRKPDPTLAAFLEVTAPADPERK